MVSTSAVKWAETADTNSKMLQFIWKRGIPVEDTGDLSCPWSGRSWWFHDVIWIQVAEDMVNSHASSAFFVFQGSKCANKNSRLFRLFLWESYQQTLRVVEYLFLSFGCAFVCHFCFALSFFCRFLIRRGWLDPEPTWKVEKRHFASTWVIFLHFLCIVFGCFLHCLAFPRWGDIYSALFLHSQTKVTKNDNKIQ
jgi:hypothetical protein